MKKAEIKIQALLHAIGTAQVLMDELYFIKNESKADKIDWFVHEIKQATNGYIERMRKMNITLRQIWEHIPNEDFDAFLEAKKELLNLVQISTFEDVKQLILQVKDVHHNHRRLDLIEKILNTHCVPEIREQYRNEFGYTLEQYQEFKRMQADGFVPIYE